jgi:hypothetical protein
MNTKVFDIRRRETQVLKDCTWHSMSWQLQNQNSINSKPIHSIIFFNISSIECANHLIGPANPPKLHYTTFWRSVARRMYSKHMEATKQQANLDISLLLRTTSAQ